MNNVSRSANDTLQTLYYSKRFDTGILAGLTVHQSVTASASSLKGLRW